MEQLLHTSFSRELFFQCCIPVETRKDDLSQHSAILDLVKTALSFKSTCKITYAKYCDSTFWEMFVEHARSRIHVFNSIHDPATKDLWFKLAKEIYKSSKIYASSNWKQYNPSITSQELDIHPDFIKLCHSADYKADLKIDFSKLKKFLTFFLQTCDIQDLSNLNGKFQKFSEKFISFLTPPSEIKTVYHSIKCFKDGFAISHGDSTVLIYSRIPQIKLLGSFKFSCDFQVVQLEVLGNDLFIVGRDDKFGLRLAIIDLKALDKEPIIIPLQLETKDPELVNYKNTEFNLCFGLTHVIGILYSYSSTPFYAASYADLKAYSPEKKSPFFIFREETRLFDPKLFRHGNHFKMVFTGADCENYTKYISELRVDEEKKPLISKQIPFNYPKGDCVNDGWTNDIFYLNGRLFFSCTDPADYSDEINYDDYKVMPLRKQVITYDVADESTKTLFEKKGLFSIDTPLIFLAPCKFLQFTLTKKNSGQEKLTPIYLTLIDYVSGVRPDLQDFSQENRSKFTGMASSLPQSFADLQA
jgi:hypothetical protein